MADLIGVFFLSCDRSERGHPALLPDGVRRVECRLRNYRRASRY
jgi:hypothetical protein